MQLTRERLSIRAAVFLGFGLVLALWLFAWFQLSLRISEAQGRTEAINSRYVKAQETLSNIRARVLLASVAFRDALLDPDEANMPRYRRQLEQTYTALDDLLRAYEPVSSSAAELEQFSRLRSEVNSYRSSMLDVLASDRSRWMVEARNVLSRRVTPRRDVVIGVSESVQAVNRAGYVEQQSRIGAVYHSVQDDMWQLLGLAILIGLGVAILAVVYAGRLEQRLRRQIAKEVELSHDLQDLSAKLVTAQEHERRHIARELHDEIGQALTAIKVELAYAERSMGRDDERGLLNAARSITDTALHQVRDLSYLLHPAALDEFGLVAAVSAHVKGVASRHDLVADFVHDGLPSRLAPEIEAAAYRIVQEALTNVVRHAAATECRVQLSLGSDSLRVVIEDNGTGFDPDAVRHGDRRGLGLVGMRERASYLQGTVEVETAPGRGTRVVVELPVRRAVDRSKAPSHTAALAS